MRCFGPPFAFREKFCGGAEPRHAIHRHQTAASYISRGVMYDDGTTNEIRCGSVEDQRLCDRQRKLVADQLSDYELPSANKNPAEEPAPVSRP
ncbi:hypothetical protein O6H91_05G097700 [Diphasiastrum complanatum]|uniref:Uncharacterized protein n=1 Tax=Diphasiastrum complanatum TaxID=34168 RepID=A0ACC2DRL1_DIPCM|nr:hypothetical protein O6H91_05G097700 [Diphasiastrum complanatum]